MTANDFCNFFDFYLEPVSNDTINENDLFYSNECKYVAIDSQGVFSNRYIKEPEELANCFDSMLYDYIDSGLEDTYGFKYDEKSDKTYYEQALAWIESQDDFIKDCYKDIIYSLVNPKTIKL